MNTKRIPLALAAMLVVCAALVYIVGTMRPLAPSPKFNPITPTLAAMLTTTPTAERATPAPTRELLPTPVTPDFETPVSFSTVAPAVPRDPQEVEATQTAVLAVQTLDAIATRAQATPKPSGAARPTRVAHNTTNFLLIGTDTRTADPNWQPNTDVIMLLMLDTTNQRAALLSFPRDLVVAIPGHEAFRINYAYHYGWEKGGVEGGVGVLKQVLHDEFGLRVDHWALIDFNGLNKIVDTLGGIEVNVPCALSDTIDNQSFTIPAGKILMDYPTVKHYVQSRYSTSDTSRNYRQQRVIWAMATRALALNAPDRVPLLYDQLKDSVATDMSVLDMVSLVPAVYQMDLQNHAERLHARVLQTPAVYPWVSPSGAWLFMPNYDEINKELDTLFDAPQIAATSPTQAECPPQASTPPPTDAPTVSPTASPTP